MRPITLRFSGLNSYRTQQVVDFDQLGGEGLFGIFGPTGSGKSSILDAISLALYGAVDRASNNTRGIIHQMEKVLDVSFEFELGGCRYSAERRYERNSKDPDSAVAKQARLRRFTPGGEEDVLASKPQEVTARIEEILGIRREEFARAVVLPQGKFDQFLRLSGGDRAAMLEHLFNFEQFGETLVAKVKQEVGACLEQLQRIEGEEQGLGDCSKEAVAQAETDLKVKDDENQKAEKAFETTDKLFKEAAVVKELVTKRNNVLAEQAQLEQKRGVMEEKQTRLDLAEHAEPLREIIHRQKELTKKIAEEQRTYEEKSRLHKETVTRHAAVKTVLDQAEGAYEKQFPQLQEKKVLYEAGLEKQKKCKDLQKTADGKQQQLEDIAREIAEAQETLAGYQQGLNDVLGALADLQKTRAQLVVNPEERITVERALELLARLETGEKRVDEEAKNFSRRREINETNWAILVEKVHELLPEKDVVPGDALGVWAKDYLDGVEQGLNDARQALQGALVINSAAELVKELHDGEACPVCGSKEHPRPAQAIDEVDQLKVLVKAGEEKWKEARRWEENLRKILQNWENSAALAQDAQKDLDRAKLEQKDLQADFDTARSAFDRETLRQRKEAIVESERRLQEADQERESLLGQQQALNEQLTKGKETLQSFMLQEVSLQGERKNIIQQVEEFVKELTKICDGQDLTVLLQGVEETILCLRREVEKAKKGEQEVRQEMDGLAQECARLEATLDANQKELIGVWERLTTGLAEAGFTDAAQAETGLLASAERQTMRKELEHYQKALAIVGKDLENLNREMGDRVFDEASFEKLAKERQELLGRVDRLKADLALAKNRVEQLRKKQERWSELQQLKTAVAKRKALAEETGSLLRGRKFVSFLAQEHLRDMTLEASYQLGRLSGQRYALELAKEKDCEFVIRDDFNGGNRRAINSLSGGEIFLTSLALALALSSKIQLRGKYPLGFFFLDEGFGTLDEEKLDKVMNALEKLHDKNRMVGIISHVRELKERLPRYLEVIPAGEAGSGSRIQTC